MTGKRVGFVGASITALRRSASRSRFLRLAALSLFALGIVLTVTSLTSIARPFASVYQPRYSDDDGIKDVLAPSLTLVRPNGAEIWEAGTDEMILWSYVSLMGDVRVEYSTNGAKTWKPISAATPGPAGAFLWTVPDDPSTDVFVRVSSNLDATISDTNDAPFTVKGVYSFEDSYASVIPVNSQGGHALAYSIYLFESAHATMTLTNAVPIALSYEFESLRIEPGSKRLPQYDGGVIQWTDVVSRTEPVTIMYRAQVTETTATMTVVNPIRVSRNGGPPLVLDVLSFVNGYAVYLPLGVRNG